MEPTPLIDAPATTDRVALYRHYDATGQLLYVGITDNPIARRRWHATNSREWISTVARTSLEWHTDRWTAFQAEAAAIRDEKPRHNVLRSSKRSIGVGNTPRRTIRIEDQIWDRVRASATERGETLSDVVRDALAAYIG